MSTVEVNPPTVLAIMDITTLIDAEITANFRDKKLWNFETSNFNPSIALLDGETGNNEYIVSVRVISCNTQAIDTSPIKRVWDYRHPWLSKWNREGLDIGVTDGTLFFKFTPNEKKQITLFEIDAGPSDMEVDNVDPSPDGSVKSIKIDGNFFTGVDTRVYKTTFKQYKENTYILIFNGWSNWSDYHPEARNYTPQSILNPGEKCTTIKARNAVCAAHYCGHIMYMYICVQKGKVKILSTPKKMCPACSEVLEKNWSIGTSLDGNGQKKQFISYGLSGSHTYFDNWTGEEHDNKCAYVKSTNELSTKISNIEHITTKAIQFSLSTPYVELEGDKLLAVGHIKIDKTKLDYSHNHDLKNSAINFYNKIKSNQEDQKQRLEEHYTYTYAMYMYVINKNTLALEHISRLFVPVEKNEEHMVYFPSGLCSPTPDGPFILSYGVGDIFSKIAIFEKKDIIELFESTQGDIKDYEILTMCPRKERESKGGNGGQNMTVLGKSRQTKKIGRITYVFYNRKWLTLSDIRMIESEQLKKEKEKKKIKK